MSENRTTPGPLAPPPERRLRLKLDLHADDLDALHDALVALAHELLLDGREQREVTSGGWDKGYHLTLEVTDPEQTGDRFREQLKAWQAARRAERWEGD